MPDWLYWLLVRWGVIVSPSLAFKHAVEGKASKREFRLLADSARNLGRVLDQSESTDEIDELLEMQSDWHHPGWDR
jgi:hypothetical protein